MIRAAMTTWALFPPRCGPKSEGLGAGAGDEEVVDVDEVDGLLGVMIRKGD